MRHCIANIILLVLLGLSVAACGASDESGAPQASTGPNTADAYLEEAIRTIEQHWIFADRVDWAGVRREASAELEDASTPEDAYAVIDDILRGLGDSHSFFVPPQLVAPLASPSLTAPLDPNARLPSGQLLAGRIGLLRLPEITALGETAELYRRTGVETIAALDAPETCGWVVDLRGNRGGRMWTMITAAGPLVGEGEIGAFVFRDGRRLAWEYRDGNGIVDGEVITSGPSHALSNPDPPVAVLINERTGSAAEGAALAFRNRPDARLFGEPTAGVATSPETYELSDGAAVVVSGAWMADRTGATFDGPIEPDVTVENWGGLSTRTPVDEDEILQAALDWLMAMPQCRPA